MYRGETRRNDTTLPFDRVMGIITPDAMLRDRNYNSAGHYWLKAHCLPARAAEGIVTFFTRCYMLPPDESTTPSRELLIRTIHEGEAADPARIDLEDYDITPRDSSVLEAGKTYALGSDIAPRYQGVVGLAQPALNLAVLGEKRMLAITQTATLYVAMGATTVHEICPSAPPAENPT